MDHPPADPPPTAKVSSRSDALVREIVGDPPRELDSEQFSTLLHATDQRGESLLWMLAGFSGGVAAVTTVLSHVGVAALAAIAFIILAALTGAAKKHRQKELRRKVDALVRQVKEDARAELAGELEAKRLVLEATMTEAQAAAQAARERAETLAEERDAIRAQTEQEFIAAQNLADRAIAEAWTPDVAMGHIEIEPSVVALFAADRHTRKPTLLVEWRLTALARVPCDIIIEGGTCTVFTLPAPGQAICNVRLGRTDVPFDGTLAPGSISVRKPESIELSEGEVTALRNGLAAGVAVSALLEIDSAIRVAGVLHRSPKTTSFQRLLTSPPEWLRAASPVVVNPPHKKFPPFRFKIGLVDLRGLLSTDPFIVFSGIVENIGPVVDVENLVGHISIDRERCNQPPRLVPSPLQLESRHEWSIHQPLTEAMAARIRSVLSTPTGSVEWDLSNLRVPSDGHGTGLAGVVRGPLAFAPESNDLVLQQWGSIFSSPQQYDYRGLSRQGRVLDELEPRDGKGGSINVVRSKEVGAPRAHLLHEAGTGRSGGDINIVESEIRAAPDGGDVTYKAGDAE